MSEFKNIESINDEDFIPNLLEIKKSYEVGVEEPTAQVSSDLSQSIAVDGWQMIENNMSKATIEGTNLLTLEGHYEKLYRKYGDLKCGYDFLAKTGNEEIFEWKKIVAIQYDKLEKTEKNLAETEKRHQESINILKRIARDRIKEVNTLKETIANKDAKIDELNKENDYLNADKEKIQKLETGIAERDNCIKVLEKALNEKDETIKNLKKINFPPEATKILPRTIKSTFEGIITTFSKITEKEERENYLKSRTYYSSRGFGYGEFFTALKNNKRFINGRGTPDTFGSFVNLVADKTPLIIAAEDGNMVAVKALIESGACPNYIDRDYKTALDYADEGDSSEHEKVANFLEDNGAKKARYLFNLKK